MDALGGNGNGLAWFAANASSITHHPFYQEYSQQQFKDIDAAQVKGRLGLSYGSTESAPIANYLAWVLTQVLAVA
jgi:hypothetical protein